ncbi:MAG: hypothetical protein IJ484_07085 [Oscillospiraceae bacterium]|nr:hypothetical protein [Oscillospiraceae bacterium]
MESNINLTAEKTARDPFSRMDDGYYEMEAAIAARVRLLKDGNHPPIFRTDVENLYDLYLANIPAEGRDHYTCQCCRRFINQYGGLVMVDEASGRLISLMWDEKDEAINPFFKPAVQAMRRAVETAHITGQFLTDHAMLGTPRTGIWSHMHLELPNAMVVRSRAKTSDQLMAEKYEDFRILITALEKYSYDTINTAIEQVLLHQDAYRADRVLGQAEQFRKAARVWASQMSPNARRNLIWLIVGRSHPGTLHIASSPVGELMDNLMDGESIRVCRAKFASRMQTYQVSQSAPTENEAVAAERMVEQLGLTESLQRRYAHRDELPAEAFLWQDKGEQPETVDASARSNRPTGVFANLITRERKAADAAAASAATSAQPADVMSWARFARTVLPHVVRMEAKADNSQRLMALAAAVNPDAENILRYGNSFSWYYNGGSIDVRMKEHIEAANGRYENVQIRHSLMWENENPSGSYGTDLDNHCITPMGSHIFYGSPRDRTGGALDVDANACGRRTMTVPVENIRWVSGASNGHYRFYVYNYCQMDRTPNRFKAELAVGDQVWAIEDVAGSTGSLRDTFSFDYRDGVVTNLRMGGSPCEGAGAGGIADWNLEANAFVPVTAVVTSPNLWGDKAVPSLGSHTFFLLEGCRDNGEGRGRGFIAETMVPELTPYRRTLNAYTTQSVIEGADTADACGMGYSEQGEWNLTLRVLNRSGSTRIYRIDRFD